MKHKFCHQCLRNIVRLGAGPQALCGFCSGNRARLTRAGRHRYRLGMKQLEIESMLTGLLTRLKRRQLRRKGLA